jgi:hypothetical protein
MEQQRVPDEFLNPHERAQILRQSIVHPLDAERGIKGCPPSFDDTHRVEPKAGRYALHVCGHRLPVRDARRRCADGVLKVADLSARSKRATAWVRTLRERVKFSSWG